MLDDEYILFSDNMGMVRGCNSNAIPRVATMLEMTIHPEINPKKVAKGRKCCMKRNRRNWCRWSIIHLNFIIFWWAVAPLIALHQIFFYGNDFTTNSMEPCVLPREFIEDPKKKSPHGKANEYSRLLWSLCFVYILRFSDSLIRTFIGSRNRFMASLVCQSMYPALFS